jgi:hypothetical protein
VYVLDVARTPPLPRGRDDPTRVELEEIFAQDPNTRVLLTILCRGLQATVTSRTEREVEAANWPPLEPMVEPSRPVGVAPPPHHTHEAACCGVRIPRTELVESCFERCTISALPSHAGANASTSSIAPAMRRSEERASRTIRSASSTWNARPFPQRQWNWKSDAGSDVASPLMEDLLVEGASVSGTRGSISYG